MQALSWTRSASPFGWYLSGDPLSNGVQPAGGAALLGATAVLVVAGTALFTRRDLA